MQRPHFLDEIRRIRAHRPLVSVGADFAFHIEVIQEREFLCQRVVIRSGPLRKEAKLRVAIPLWQIAQDLIVSAVLLDDINTVVEGAVSATFGWNGIPRCARSRDARLGPQRTAPVGLRRPLRELRFKPLPHWQVNHAQRAPKKPCDVLNGQIRITIHPGCGPSGLALGTSPFPLATSRCLPSGVARTDVGYQPTGMNPSERLLPGVLTSKTATTLLSALATNNVRSSGESARLFGVLPGSACG